ncbi:MAG: IPT/TIG domain-containing protein [Terracidiphilus sp.]|nr:IPT/TIG domain-containing protein [Terracidiphilus sp.]
MKLNLTRLAFVLCGLLPLIVTGCGGGGGNSTAPIPSPPSADFSLTFNPSTATIQTGSSIAVQIKAQWSGATTAPITVSIAGLPQGVTSTPAGSISIPAGSTSATLSLTAALNAALGASTINATATAQIGTSIQHQYSVALAVKAPAVPLPPPARTSYILTGEAPENIVYDRAHKLLYASVPSLNQVLIIDPKLHKILKALTVPAAGQSDLSLDGSQIVVGSDLVAALTFISTASQSITRVVPLTIAENGINFFGNAMSQFTQSPVFLSGGDVLFISGYVSSSLYRWSAVTGGVKVCNGQPSSPGAYPTSLSRTTDGSKVLVTTVQYETDVYDAVTDSVTARNTAHSVFAGADPTSSRFAVDDSNGFEVVDTNLHQLASLPFSTGTASMPYGLKFSLDGSKMFVAQSGLFGGLYALRTVEMENFAMGSQAPLMSFNGNDEVSNDVDSEVPLAIDENDLIYGRGNRGIAIDDPLNYYSSSTPANGRGFEFFKPDAGPVGVATQTSPHNSYAANTGVYFFTSATDVTPSGTVGTGSNGLSTITTPPISRAGPASIEMVEPDGSFSFYPAAYSFGTQALAVEPAAGPASGGISADVIAYGAGGGISAVTVTVGGAPATVTSVVGVGGLNSNPLPVRDITFTVPPGVAGTKADVTLTASGNSSTLAGAFTYEQQISSYPYPSSDVPSSILYDPHRQRVYLLTANQVDVFSLSSRSFLAPIVPPTLNGKMSLTGLDLSVDGSKLVIANLADQSIAIVNPDSPASSPRLVPLVIYLFGTSYPGGPYSVAATSKGTFFIGTSIPQLSGATGSLYELDPGSGALQQRSNISTSGLNTAGYRLLRSADGTKVFIASPNSTGGPIVLWNSTTDTFAGLTTQGFADDGAISADGTTVGALVDNPGAGLFQFVLDSSFNTLNNIVPPEGLGEGLLYGQFFNPSGALLYVPGNHGIDVYDVHEGTLRKRIAVKEPNIVNIYQAATMDDTGKYLFLMTSNGLDVIEDDAPLSVRSASPSPNTVPAGTVITLRGASFQPGATVTIGGQTVPSTVTDSYTLSFSLPSIVTDLDFTVTNPDASSYSY